MVGRTTCIERTQILTTGTELTNPIMYKTDRAVSPYHLRVHGRGVALPHAQSMHLLLLPTTRSTSLRTHGRASWSSLHSKKHEIIKRVILVAMVKLLNTHVSRYKRSPLASSRCFQTSSPAPGKIKEALHILFHIHEMTVPCSTGSVPVSMPY